MDRLQEKDKGKRPLKARSFKAWADDTNSKGMADFIPDHLGDACSSFTSRGISNLRKDRKLEVCNPSCADSNGTVTKSMAADKTDICELPNLALSLLPPRSPMGTESSPYQRGGRFAAQGYQFCPFPYSPNPDIYSSPKAGAEQPLCAQLTIFYAGTVNVYNVSADKAKAIIMAASRISDFQRSGTPSSSASTPSTHFQRSGTPSSSASTPSTQHNSTPRGIDMDLITSSPTPVAISQPQSPETIKSAALQITKKSCIQRFLEKRNERIHGKSPYLPPAQN
eukprot:PITA_23035